MFNGAHVILYSADAELDRAFLRDVCGFANVVAELAAKGVAATAPVDVRWGIVATITLPSGAPLSIYEPRHPLARDLNG